MLERKVTCLAANRFTLDNKENLNQNGATFLALCTCFRSSHNVYHVTTATGPEGMGRDEVSTNVSGLTL